MSANPLQLLEMFARFAGVGLDLVQEFAADNPHLIQPGDADAPEPAPVEDIDPNVRRLIEDGDV